MNRAWNGDLTLQDRVKRCYQRAFGAEHMMADEAAALARLRAECASLSAPGPQETCFEPLGNGLCRLHLRPALAAGLSVETIHRLFVWSAGRPRDGRADFDAALEALAVTDEARAWVDAYRAQGCPPPRHSDAYRRAFAPAYRVVDAAFARAMPLLLRLERLSRGLVAIDGPCASGKTTLANALGGALGLTVFHMDDFFLRPSQRTPERLAEPAATWTESASRRRCSAVSGRRRVFLSPLRLPCAGPGRARARNAHARLPDRRRLLPASGPARRICAARFRARGRADPARAHSGTERRAHAPAL